MTHCLGFVIYRCKELFVPISNGYTFNVIVEFLYVVGSKDIIYGLFLPYDKTRINRFPLRIEV